MKRWYRGDARMAEKMGELLRDICKTFGWKTRLLAPITGLYALLSLKREEKRLKEGWTYEPKSFSEKNAAALALEGRRPLRVKIAIPDMPFTIGTPAPVPER
jgi:hypothetical protein